MWIRKYFEKEVSFKMNFEGYKLESGRRLGKGKWTPGRGTVYIKIQRNESVLGELKADGYDCMKFVRRRTRWLRGKGGIQRANFADLCISWAIN